MAGLLDGNLRRLAFDDAVALSTHGEGGVEHDGMALHQAIEEVPQGRQMLVARGDARRGPQLLKILPHMPRRDLCQLAPAVLRDPVKKQLHGVQVGAPRMFIADGSEEEFL